MAQTLTVLLAAAREELGSPSTTILPDADITERLNQSYLELASRFRHPELETSVSVSMVDGTQAYANASDHYYTIAIRDETNDRKLQYRKLEWILAQDTDTKGDGQYWTRHGTNFLIYPTPNSADTYTQYYVKIPTELSAGTDTTDFDNQTWDEILKWGAVWRLFNMLGQQDRMIHARNIWRTLINSMPETHMLEGERGHQIIGPMNAMFPSPVPGNYTGPTE